MALLDELWIRILSTIIIALIGIFKWLSECREIGTPTQCQEDLNNRQETTVDNPNVDYIETQPPHMSNTGPQFEVRESEFIQCSDDVSLSAAQPFATSVSDESASAIPQNASPIEDCSILTECQEDIMNMRRCLNNRPRTLVEISTQGAVAVQEGGSVGEDGAAASSGTLESRHRTSTVSADFVDTGQGQGACAASPRDMLMQSVGSLRCRNGIRVSHERSPMASEFDPLRLAAALAEHQQLVNWHMCKKCWFSPFKFVLIPCGHLLCRPCCYQAIRCPICDKRINLIQECKHG